MSYHPACVTIERHDGQPPTLVLRCDVNIYCAGLLHESADVLLQEQEDVVVSCEGLAHLDTSALQILLSLQQGLLAQGRNLRLEGISAELEGMLQLAGVNSALCPQAGNECN